MANIIGVVKRLANILTTTINAYTEKCIVQNAIKFITHMDVHSHHNANAYPLYGRGCIKTICITTLSTHGKKDYINAIVKWTFKTHMHN